MKHTYVALAVAAATLAVAAGDARSQKEKAPPPGSILFVRGGALFRQSPDGKGDATEVAKLPEGAATSVWLETTPDGKIVTIDLGSSAAWLVDGGWRSGGCVGRARPSPAGECVVCRGADGGMLVSTTRDLARTLPSALGELGFLGGSATELAALTDEGVVAVSVPDGAVQRVLARPGARSHVLVSPDGGMAAAVYGEKDASRVYSLVLDGKGVPRRLGGPGIPVAWSWDSRWVIVQEGILPDGDDDDDNDDEPDDAGPDGANERESPWVLAVPKKRAPPPKKKGPPPKKKAPPPKKDPAPAEPEVLPTRACIVRAVGGESKCWDGYEGLAFSPDNTLVLLRKGTALYLGRIAGVNPDPPRKVIDDVDGAATWSP